MEARSRVVRIWIGILATLVISANCCPAGAANSRTQNFIVQADSPQLAQQVGAAAERFRRDLAVYWLGQPLPPWPTPCPIRVIAGPTMAAQGVTTYNPRPVRDFQMEVVGTPQRILDSVLPHEVTHTVLATYFGRPLPRWADEGICTTVEHEAERSKHEKMLRQFLRSRRGIAMNHLFRMTEYPSDILPMYAQGYSVCQFLIAQKGPRTFIQFLRDYMHYGSWTDNVKKHYDYDSLGELQEYWIAWVDAGSQDVTRFAKTTGPGSGEGSRGASPLQLADAGGHLVGGERSPSEGPATPLPDTAALAAVTPAASSALASTIDQGWYQRRRDRVAQGDVPAAPGVNQSFSPIAPPSVTQSGRYSASQPQPPGGMHR